MLNPDWLNIGRQFRGMPQKSLAEESGLSQGYLSKLGKGEVVPSDEAVSRIADALSFPMCFFYQQIRMKGLPISVHPMYRKRSSLGKKQLEKILAEVNIRIAHIKKIIKNRALNSRYNFSNVIDNAIDAQTAAKQVRHLWGVSSTPIENLSQYIEQSGCIISLCNFHGAQIDGLTMQLSNLPPLIFLNRHIPADRARFTLAHELGHIVLHRTPSPEMEQEANDFAAELLMPASAIQGELYNLDLYKLATLKPQWRVSMGALLMRAKTLNTITENQSSYLWRQMSMAGYRKREPAELDFEKEQPETLNCFIQSELQHCSITTLCKDLCIREEDFRDMYLIN